MKYIYKCCFINNTAKDVYIIMYIRSSGKPCRLHASLLLVENQLLTYAENDRERVWVCTKTFLIPRLYRFGRKLMVIVRKIL